MKTKPALLLLSLPLSTVLAENPARPGPAPAAQVTPATRLTPGAILAAQIREISGTKDLSHASKIRQIASAARLALTTTLTNVKDPEQAVRLALDLAADWKIRAHKGVYVAVTGPNLETRAEYRWLSQFADVVGMSTVPEVIAAVHGGMKVLGISVITDECIADRLKPADIREIIRIAGEAEPKLTRLMAALIGRMEA